jgi:hypothetical protein
MTGLRVEGQGCGEWGSYYTWASSVVPLGLEGKRVDPVPGSELPGYCQGSRRDPENGESDGVSCF